MSSYLDILNKKQKDWNCPDLMSSSEKDVCSKIPFSSPLLNHSTYGGIPRNAITEFLGEPGGGKSTTAVDICKNAIKEFKAEYDKRVSDLQARLAAGDKSADAELDDVEEMGCKKVLYVDLEHTFNKQWADKLGIIPGSIDIMQPPNVTAEDILQTVQDLIETGHLGLVVLDSIPSLVTKLELSKEYGQSTVAALPKLLTEFFRKIIPVLTRYGTTMLLINQTRDNMDNPYVLQSPGGKALKFYSSLRMYFKIGSPIDFLGNELPNNTENPAGYIVTAKIIKQKSAPWDRKNGSYYLMTDSGIRIDMDYCQLAMKRYGFIKKGGAWFTMCDPYTGEILQSPDGKPIKLNGMAKVYEYVQTHPDYFDMMKQFITDDIEGNPIKQEVSQESDEIDEH